MKPIPDLENDILHITMKINTQFAELVKYLEEMPLRISETDTDVIQNKNLAEYYNSLVVLVNKYAKTHLSNNSMNPTQVTPNAELPLDDFPKKEEEEVEEEEMNEKNFEDDMSGDDLDVPGAELDDQQESVGSEDEENNYYSLGGDNHIDLEEDNA